MTEALSGCQSVRPNGGGRVNTILVVIGIFAGIGVFLATMYSLTQILLLEGKGRIAHAASFVTVLAIMTVLYVWRDTGLARLIAIPLLPIAAWTFWIEARWYKVFPILTMLFALTLVLGYVALNKI